VTFKNLAVWAEQGWKCLSCGTPNRAVPRRYGTPDLQDVSPRGRQPRTVDRTQTPPAGGAEPTPETVRGLTIPRPVHVTLISHLGKEVIVDPSDTTEDLTAEELNATEPVIYLDEDARINGLRARVRAVESSAWRGRRSV